MVNLLFPFAGGLSRIFNSLIGPSWGQHFIKADQPTLPHFRPNISLSEADTSLKLLAADARVEIRPRTDTEQYGMSMDKFKRIPGGQALETSISHI